MAPRYFRKIIRITAHDSPNVRLGLIQQQRGVKPTNEVLIPGVLPWADYVKRLAMWDPIRQTIGLWGEFYEGGEVLLFPPQWLERAHQHADVLVGRKRTCQAIGIDPAEGGDETAMTAIDEYGIIEQVSRRTPNTNEVYTEALAFMKKHDMLNRPEYVAWDRGGGGKQHADRMRAQGLAVTTIAFGDPASSDMKRGIFTFPQRVEKREEGYAYMNRRAEMYGCLSLLLDPDNHVQGGLAPYGFAIPRQYTELRRQLAPIPRTYDPEGRLFILPKDVKNQNSDQRTLKGILGCSPDRADSLVLAVHVRDHKGLRSRAGPINQQA
jgi:hypothetical protein